MSVLSKGKEKILSQESSLGPTTPGHIRCLASVPVDLESLLKDLQEEQDNKVKVGVCLSVNDRKSED